MKGKIYIIGDIGYCGYDIQGIELVDVIEQVRNQPEAKSFDVYINSGGGNVETGEDIYNYLKNLKVPVTTIGTGIVASIATVIFMAGSTRRVTPGTEFMIHLPMGSVEYKTADEIKLYADEVRQVENRMVKFYMDCTNLEKEAILPLLKNETWLSEAQLESFGFTNAGQLKIAAKANFNINPKTNKMSKKSESLLQQIFDAVTGKGGSITSRVLYTANEEEVDFFELDSETLPSVGDKATINGEQAEGEHVMQDGQTFIFVGGELDTINEAEEEEETTEDEMTLEEAMQALDIANAQVIDLTGERDELSTEVATLTQELKEKKAIIAKIENIRSKFAKQTKTKTGGKTAKKKDKSRFSKALASVK